MRTQAEVTTTGAITSTRLTADNLIATSATIAGYEPAITAGYSYKFLSWDKTWRLITQAMVSGLETTATVTHGGLTISGTASLNGAVNGDRLTLQCQQLTTFTLGGGEYQYLADGQVPMRSDKGFTAIKAGSLVGVSINYDVSAVTDGDAYLIIDKNGGSCYSLDLTGDTTTGSGKTQVATATRGDYAFSAGDVLAVSIQQDNSGSIAISNVVVQLLIHYD